MKFESMFSTIHDGNAPFPWQSEAAGRLLTGEPFSAINVPTATGKTAMIDAAIYAAAHGGRRHIAFIIDRRVVVDEAYARAQRIVEALKTKPSLAELAERIGPIQVVRLRGGVHGDDDWVLYPDKITVIVSTVDQIGSRLLHRGYGVSSRMAPLHAGFLGNDAIYIVDEAHLSVPFVETVKSACRYGADIRLIEMTATPIAEVAKTIELSEEDGNHPMLAKRLGAIKLAELIQLSDKEEEFTTEAVSRAQKIAQYARVIGIVVNRVSTARQIRDSLAKAQQRAELLTGRIRPYDRDRLMEGLLPEIRAGRVRADGPSLFVVATQTVEVGADIDFDALVTEAATLDALRQRFGRLDRLGHLGNSQAVILYRPKLDNKSKIVPDPIYGEGMQDAWMWLQQVATDGRVDFGINAMEELMGRIEPPGASPKQAPVLLPTHVALLANTGPDAPYVDVSPWLHGAESGSADVSFIWRADLDLENSEVWAQTVRLRPPLTQEALEVPLYAVRGWLENRRVQEVTDLEGVALYATAPGRSDQLILRWRDADDCDLITSEDIRPGDTLVLPSKYGGCDRYGWAPNSKEPVEDIADFCSLERQRDHVVRLVPGLVSWLGDAEAAVLEAVREVVASETDVDPEIGIDHDRVEAAHSTLRDLLAKVQHPLIKAFRGRFEIEMHPKGVALRGRVIDEVKATLNSGVAVELEKHLGEVARLTDQMALGDPERERLVTAARRHDLGKAEPRFQTMLYGNPFAATEGPLLAKSGFRRLSQIRAAYAESGLPEGFRHELASLVPLQEALTSELNMLTRHLIATHHGYGRSWFPACADPQAPGANLTRLGSGWVQAFAALLKKHGPWKLAWMELLLRAADIRQSRAEQVQSNV